MKSCRGLNLDVKTLQEVKKVFFCKNHHGLRWHSNVEARVVDILTFKNVLTELIVDTFLFLFFVQVKTEMK